MKVFFLGAYSAAGMQGMMSSTYATRVAAVKKMVEKVGGKLGAVTYLQGPFDVIADVEVCLLYTSPSPRDGLLSRMPSSA